MKIFILTVQQAWCASLFARSYDSNKSVTTVFDTVIFLHNVGASSIVGIDLCMFVLMLMYEAKLMDDLDD